MRFFQRFISILSFAMLALSSVHAADMKGPGFITLPDAQATEAGKKVEVIEFFWYGCPHCHAFDPDLHAWVKKQGDTISFKRIPVAFRPEFMPQVKAYYALESMGKLEQLHPKIFEAIHKKRQKLDTDAALVDFVVANGVDKIKFQEALTSFSVDAKAKRVPKLQTAYRIDGVPAIVVDGRYLTSPAKVAETMERNATEGDILANTLKVMDGLVQKSAKK